MTRYHPDYLNRQRERAKAEALRYDEESARKPAIAVSKRKRLSNAGLAEQTSCMLLSRLPLEVRTLIYVFAMCDEDADCDETSILVRWKRPTSELMPLPHTFPYRLCHDNIRDEQPLRPLSLLQACHQTYDEAIQILYTERNFAFQNMDDLLSFRQLIRPNRLHAITALSLNLSHDFALPMNEFKEAFSKVSSGLMTTIADMPSLHTLRIYFVPPASAGDTVLKDSPYHGGGPRRSLRNRPEYWDPLRDLCSLPQIPLFLVYIYWQQDGTPEAPYKIRLLTGAALGQAMPRGWGN